MCVKYAKQINISFLSQYLKYCNVELYKENLKSKSIFYFTIFMNKLKTLYYLTHILFKKDLKD